MLGLWLACVYLLLRNKKAPHGGEPVGKVLFPVWIMSGEVAKSDHKDLSVAGKCLCVSRLGGLKILEKIELKTWKNQENYF